MYTRDWGFLKILLCLLCLCGCARTMNPHTEGETRVALHSQPQAECPWRALNGQEHTRFPEHHYIMVHKDGYPIDRNEHPIYSRKERPDFQKMVIEPILSSIDEHVKKADAEGQTPAQLLLFFHGGLNFYEDGFSRIETLVNENERLGASSYYPVFINWNSSFGSCVWDDLAEIRFGRRYRWAGYPTAPFLLAGRLAESGFTAPQAWWAQAQNAVDNFLETEDPRPPVFDRVWAGVSYFGILPLRVASIPLIRTFGTPAWEIMKRRADLVLASRLETNPYAREGAGHTFIDALRKKITAGMREGKPVALWKVEGQKVPIEITLIGHSMGALIVNRLLQMFPDLMMKRIIYLAAAASIEDVEGTIIPYLQLYKETNFWNFSLSNWHETGEKVAYDLFERGSLLVWIDHLFERVLTPQQKRIGKYMNYTTSTINGEDKYDYQNDYDLACVVKDRLELEEDKTRVHVRKISENVQRPSENACAPTSHGDFSTPSKLQSLLCITAPKEFSCSLSNVETCCGLKSDEPLTCKEDSTNNQLSSSLH